MGNAKRDQNYVTSLLAISNIDPTALVELWGDPSTHRLLVNAVVSGNVLVAGVPLNGQKVIAVTGTAVQLASNALSNGVIVTAKSTNTAAIVVGASTVTNVTDGTGAGYILEAGASVSWAMDNTNRLWINGTAGDIVSYAGS